MVSEQSTFGNSIAMADEDYDEAELLQFEARMMASFDRFSASIRESYSQMEEKRSKQFTKLENMIRSLSNQRCLLTASIEQETESISSITMQTTRPSVPLDDAHVKKKLEDPRLERNLTHKEMPTMDEVLSLTEESVQEKGPTKGALLIQTKQLEQIEVKEKPVVDRKFLNSLAHQVFDGMSMWMDIKLFESMAEFPKEIDESVTSVHKASVSLTKSLKSGNSLTGGTLTYGFDKWLTFDPGGLFEPEIEVMCCFGGPNVFNKSIILSSFAINSYINLLSVLEKSFPTDDASERVVYDLFGKMAERIENREHENLILNGKTDVVMLESFEDALKCFQIWVFDPGGDYTQVVVRNMPLIDIDVYEEALPLIGIVVIKPRKWESQLVLDYDEKQTLVQQLCGGLFSIPMSLWRKMLVPEGSENVTRMGSCLDLISVLLWKMKMMMNCCCLLNMMKMEHVLVQEL